MRPQTSLALAVAAIVAAVAWLAFDSRVEPPVVAPPAPATAPAAEPAPSIPLVAVPDAPAEAVAESSAPGERGAVTQAPTTLDATTPPVDSDARTLLYGFVRPDPGAARLLDRPQVRATDRLGRRVGAECGADGAYAIPDLAPGRWWIASESRRDGRVEAVLDIDGAQAELRFDLALKRVPQVLVKAVDRDGQPADRWSLVAIATTTAPGDWFDEVHGSSNNPFGVGRFDFNLGDEYSDEQGTASQAEGYIGRLQLDVEPPVFVSLVSYQRTIATQRVERDQREVVFVLDTDSPLLRQPTVRGRAIDAQTREPLPGAAVMLDGNGGRSGKADGDGVFTFPRCPTGWAMLQVTAPDHGRLQRCLRIEPGEDIDLGDVEVGAGRFIEGFVVDADGQGVAARLEFGLVDPVTGRTRRVGSIRMAQTRDDGSFRIGGLSNDVYCVQLSARGTEWGCSARTVDLRAGSLENARIVAERSVGLLVRPSGEAWRGVRYQIFDAGGERVIDSRLWSAAPSEVPLAAGSYEVEVTVGDQPPTRRRITIAREAVELALP